MSNNAFTFGNKQPAGFSPEAANEFAKAQEDLYDARQTIRALQDDLANSERGRVEQRLDAEEKIARQSERIRELRGTVARKTAECELQKVHIKQLETDLDLAEAMIGDKLDG